MLTESLLSQFALVLVLATILGIVMHYLRQPLVAAYILTGIFISFLPMASAASRGPLEFLPTIGIAFLLFLIGIELDFRELKAIGKPIVLASLTQMAVTTTLVTAFINYLGFPVHQALLIGLALSFSSTIVIIKLLIDKQEVSTLHGRVAIGILLIEDLVAVLALMSISIITSVDGLHSAAPFIILAVKGVVFLAIVVLLTKFVIGRLFTILAASHELLFFSSISWCFLFIAIATSLGFSMEIGAFLGGVSLATSPFRFQIAGRLKPLRDFFIAIFFIELGLQIVLPDVLSNIGLIGLFAVVALLVKPIELMAILSLLGFRRFTTYHTATALSQISEFSVILFLTAQRSGLLPGQLVSVMASATIVTIFISSIVVNQNQRFYKSLGWLVQLLERDTAIKAKLLKPGSHDVILIGAHRSGEQVLTFLKKKSPQSLLVVDYNPEVVRKLKKERIAVLFGDIADPDILHEIRLQEAKVIISTVRVLKDNLALLEAAQHEGAKSISIIAAQDREEAKLLYQHGAHMVVIPQYLEGEEIVDSLEKHWADQSYYQKEKEKFMVGEGHGITAV